MRRTDIGSACRQRFMRMHGYGGLSARYGMRCVCVAVDTMRRASEVDTRNTGKVEFAGARTDARAQTVRYARGGVTRYAMLRSRARAR